MKNSSDAVGNRTREHPACSTVPPSTNLEPTVDFHPNVNYTFIFLNLTFSNPCIVIHIDEKKQDAHFLLIIYLSLSTCFEQVVVRETWSLTLREERKMRVFENGRC